VAQARCPRTNLGAPPSFYPFTVNSSSAILWLSVTIKKNKEAENLWINHQNLIQKSFDIFSA
jgi:hypothetical protein